MDEVRVRVKLKQKGKIVLQIDQKLRVEMMFQVMVKQGGHFEEIKAIDDNLINFVTDSILDLPQFLEWLKRAGIKIKQVTIHCDSESLLHCDVVVE